ncbi:MAG TPA: hypothetical protein VLS51_08330 [Propionibacteriaceae bacterium]|nr:hypothetical protein [Propionibacteriaceae bacterium]
MSFYLGYDSWTASRDAAPLPDAILRDIMRDDELELVFEQPVRTKVAALLRRAAGLQMALAARLDDAHALAA